MPERRVRAVIVNHNGAAITAGCLASLAAQSYAPLDVLVVDDCSTPAEWTLLQQLKPRHVVALRQSKPRGYAASLNLGMRSTELPPAAFMLAMNNDISLPDTETVRKLADALQENPRRVAASPLVCHVGVVLQPETAIQVRRVPDFKTVLVAHSCWLRRLPRFRGLCKRYTYDDCRPYQLGLRLDCETINGALFLVWTSFLESIGFLDENTFLYMEEQILGAQIKRSNHTACLVTSTYVDHLQGTSTGLRSGAFRPLMWLHQVRSELWYLRAYLASGPMHRGFFLLVRAVDFVAKLGLQVWQDIRGKVHAIAGTGDMR